MYNLDGRIGGDTLLSPRGEAYSKKLPQLVRESVGVCHPGAACILSVDADKTNRTIGP